MVQMSPGCESMAVNPAADSVLLPVEKPDAAQETSTSPPRSVKSTTTVTPEPSAQAPPVVFAAAATRRAAATTSPRPESRAPGHHCKYCCGSLSERTVKKRGESSWAFPVGARDESGEARAAPEYRCGSRAFRLRPAGHDGRESFCTSQGRQSGLSTHVGLRLRVSAGLRPASPPEGLFSLACLRITSEQYRSSSASPPAKYSVGDFDNCDGCGSPMRNRVPSDLPTRALPRAPARPAPQRPEPWCCVWLTPGDGVHHDSQREIAEQHPACRLHEPRVAEDGDKPCPLNDDEGERCVKQDRHRAADAQPRRQYSCCPPHAKRPIGAPAISAAWKTASAARMVSAAMAAISVIPRP